MIFCLKEKPGWNAWLCHVLLENIRNVSRERLWKGQKLKRNLKSSNVKCVENARVCPNKISPSI